MTKRSCHSEDSALLSEEPAFASTANSRSLVSLEMTKRSCHSEDSALLSEEPAFASTANSRSLISLGMTKRSCHSRIALYYPRNLLLHQPRTAGPSFHSG